MSNVMRVNGIGDGAGWGEGFAQLDISPAVTEVYVTADFRFPAFFISYVNSNPFSSEVIHINSGGGTFSVNGLSLESSGGGTGQLFIANDGGAGGPFGTIAPDTWYTIEFHIKQVGAGPNDEVDLWLDGTLLRHAVTNFSGTDIGQVCMGLIFAVDDADQQFDVDNVSIGTTRGGNELLGTDFEDGLIVPPFTSITDSSGTGASIFIFEEPTPPQPGQSAARVSVFIDEIEVTEFCLEGSVTHRLNGVGTASAKVNMRAAGSTALWGTAYPGAGSFMKVYIQADTDSVPRLWHHGRILNCETSADENAGYTVFNSSDPLELWAHRPVRDPPDIAEVWPVAGNILSTSPGNFAAPLLLLQFGDPALDPLVNGAPRVVQAMIEGSQDNSIPSDSEGPLRLRTIDSVFMAGVHSVKGAPSDFPMTMAEMASNLTSTGICDIIITPIEMDGNGNIGRIDVYNGDYGMDLSSTIAFQYGFGVNNVRALRWNEDMTNLSNKIWYYLGPKCDDKHWRANITGDSQAFNPTPASGPSAWANATAYNNTDLVTNTIGGMTFYYICIYGHTSSADTEPGVGTQWDGFWSMWLVPPGGKLSPPATHINNDLGSMIGQSRDVYDTRMDIRIFDAAGSGSGGGGDCDDITIIAPDMWRWQWQNESWLRAQPRTLIHITPTRDTAIGEFDIGDLVLVEASAEVKGGFSGVQRVYGFTISWESGDSVPAISELQTSSDQEGFLS